MTEPDEDTTIKEPPRQAAVLFAELLGITELYAGAGDAAALQATTACHDRLEQAASPAKARVLKRIGPRLMLLAESADVAARAAVAMQAAASQLPAAAGGKPGLGIGFHYGRVIQNDDDVFGDTVNLAARLVEKAARGQILLVADTAEQVGSLYRRSIRRLLSVQLKGIDQELGLCEMVWRADEPATFYPLTADAEPPARVKLKLKYRGTKLVLKRIVEAVSLGRDPQCKVVIDDEHASRHHCTIQRRRDRFVLVDKSTNGTFVTIEGEQELALRRDEITLRKSGWICFGQSRSAGGDAMEFICD